MFLTLAKTFAMGITRKKYIPDPAFGYVDIEGAATFLGASKSKLYKMVAQRSIEHYKCQGKLLFKVDELNKYLSSIRVEAVIVPK